MRDEGWSKLLCTREAQKHSVDVSLVEGTQLVNLVLCLDRSWIQH